MATKVTMHHPDVGEMQCSPAAVPIHEKRGWVQIEGTRKVDVEAADGSILTTGTVFPPETFDDEPDSPVDTASEPGAEAQPTTRALKGTKQGDL